MYTCKRFERVASRIAVKGRRFVYAQVIHGDADRNVPIADSGLKSAKLIKGARLTVVKDGPQLHKLDTRRAG